ncbi:MAG: heparan-alpha-glucosaminide N-acetyltransferase domain-containing protein, partial [Ferruginibacter sp.]
MKQTLMGKKRIESIDVLRGLAMVIMALDHVRDAIHIGANTDDPLNLATTTPALYFTRWITHFCAPVFLFISGTSIYLQSLRKTKKELSVFVLKRGIWLIIAEWTIIAFAWTFNPFFNMIPFAVIWAIGISMVLLGFAIRLPFKVVLVIGLLIVAGHNLLDIPESAPGFKAGFWWDLLHHGQFTS